MRPPPPPPRTIPALLHPYTTLAPPTSLTLLTSVLNASTNWLLLRFLCGALASDSDKPDAHDGGSKTGAAAQSGDVQGWRGHGDGEVRVVFVSFLRDWEFWRREGGRCVRCFPSPCAAFVRLSRLCCGGGASGTRTQKS